MKNHKELMNDVIQEMMTKKKSNTSNVMRIRLKMSEKPIEVPLEMIDWDTLSNSSNMENLKRNLDSLWEFTYSLLMIPKSDVIKVYDDTCNEIITEVKNFIYENFSITLQYDEIIAKTQLCAADIALLYCDDAKEILNAFINGCENYLVGERIAMLQDALYNSGKTTQIEIPKEDIKEDNMDDFDMSSFNEVPAPSMDVETLKETTLAQHVLQKRMNAIPDEFMNPDIKLDEAIMKIHEFIKAILTPEEMEYANTNPLVAEDETIHAINQKLLQNGFGDFLKDLLIKKPKVVVTNTEESIIDKKIDLDEFQDEIMNTPELEVIMQDIAKREENNQ